MNAVSQNALQAPAKNISGRQAWLPFLALPTAAVEFRSRMEQWQFMWALSFVIGHVLLTSLFAFLACSYWAIFAWHVWLRAKS